MTNERAHDAVVIGAGPNGLVAANLLADAGWQVLVLEATPEPGGAVRTAEITAPGFKNDLFSAFYPFAAASPVLAKLDLERYGLRWVHAPTVVAHPTPDGPTAVLSRSLDETVASLTEFAPSEGQAWARLYERWRQVGGPLVDALLGPLPPLRPAGRLVARVGVRNLVDFARFAMVPLRRLVEEEGLGRGGGLLLAGNALHADLTPEAVLSGFYGWLLVSLGQQVGFPVPEGGAGALTAALVNRLRARGGEVACGRPVERVTVDAGRATGVVVDGSFVGASRAVIAACDAEILFWRLIDPSVLPGRFVDRMRRFQRAAGTVKVDWALGGPIPWKDPGVSRAGTVHLADSLDELTLCSSQLAMRQLPDRPFVVVGQMTTADPTRSPAGTESAWAYTHMPATPADDADVMVERIEDRIESFAPGFRDRVLARHVMLPADLERLDPSLVGGDIGGGTQQLHQQLVFRPVPGLGRPETPVKRLFLGSASAHPGGGVHGAPGANAARAALAHDRWRRRVHAVGHAAAAAASSAGRQLAR